MEVKVKLYKVGTQFSSRELNARSKSEAIQIFKAQMKSLISDSYNIIVK